jgi:hypothetical protein
MRRFIDVTASELHRRAVEVCAVTRVTNEAVLRDALELEDAYELLEWLRLTFVECGPEGLFPHDLVRDVVDIELRWRDPENYKRLFRSVRDHKVAGNTRVSGERSMWPRKRHGP